jgi:hypothetical protein
MAENSTGSTDALLDAFVDHYYPVPDPAPVAPPADFSERADRFVGSYRDNTWAYTTVDKAAVLLDQFEVSADGDTLLFMTGQKWPVAEIGPLAFSRLNGDETVVFREDEAGRITHVFLNSLVGFAFERLQWYQSPGFHKALLITLLVVFASYLVAARVSVLIDRRRGRTAGKTDRLARAARLLLAVISLLAIVFVMAFRESFSLGAIMFGDVAMLKVLLLVPIVTTGLTAAAVVLSGLAWRHGYWALLERMHYTLATVAAVVYVWLLNYWNVLGWRF